MRMSITSDSLPAGASPVRETGTKKANESIVARPLSKAEVYARAERRMRRGKQMVISGFVVAVLGIIGYSVVCLSAGINQDLGASLLENPGWLVGPTLGIIGVGTLLWLIGSFLYLSGGMESDPDGPDLYF